MSFEINHNIISFCFCYSFCKYFQGSSLALCKSSRLNDTKLCVSFSVFLAALLPFACAQYFRSLALSLTLILSLIFECLPASQHSVCEFQALRFFFRFAILLVISFLVAHLLFIYIRTYVCMHVCMFVLVLRVSLLSNSVYLFCFSSFLSLVRLLYLFVCFYPLLWVKVWYSAAPCPRRFSLIEDVPSHMRN